MGSAERYSPKDMQTEAEQSVDQTTSLKRPTLVSPPRRPVVPAAKEPAPKESAPKELVKAQPKPSKSTESDADTITSLSTPANGSPELTDASSRYQPIAPPSEPMQYRAIGLVRGTYTPNEEEFTRGMLVTDDGADIDSVLLGRVTSLVKKHIDLSQAHLWVVYPRTRREEETNDSDLHLQIVGVWEPETLGLPGESPHDVAEDGDSVETTELAELAEALEPGEIEGLQPTEALEAAEVPVLTSEGDQAVQAENHLKPQLEDLPPVDDNYFSIRGEVLKYSEEDESIAVKILQGSKRSPGSSKAFRVMLKGTITGKTVGYFWDFQVKREAKLLVMQAGTVVGIVPPKKRKKGAGGRKGPPRRGPGGPRTTQSRRPTPIKDMPRPKKQA